MRSKAPWLLLALGVLFATPGLWLATRNGSFAADGPFIFLSIVVMAGWATVGAMLASRNPSNPIGWLMLVFGTGFSALALAEEWATYAYETNPGALPFRSFALWLSNWAFIALITPVPLILLLYPSGHVRSPRWRWVLWAALLATAFGCVGSLLQTNPIELNSTSVPNPTGVKALEGLAGALQAVAGLSWILALVPLCIASVVLRFRHARDEERQQIRWLAYVAAVGGVSFFTAILSGFGLGPNETSFVNEASFYLFFIAFGIGFPGAIGVALLKYRLWDLDIVLKKTLVAAIVVTLLTVLATAVLLLAGGILVGPVADEPGLLLVVGLVAGVLVWPVLRFARRVADRLVYGGRATPYEVLTDFSDRMAETYSTDDVLPRMAAILGEGTGAENATIWLLVGGDLRPAARWPAGADPDEPRPATMLADVDPERVRGSSPGRGPRGDHRDDACERPDEPGEGPPDPRPSGTGGPRAAQRPVDRGRPRVAPAHRGGRGRGAATAGTQHPRRGAAAARRPRGEAPPRGHDGRTRPGEGARAPGAAADRDDRRAGGPA